MGGGRAWERANVIGAGVGTVCCSGVLLTCHKVMSADDGAR